MSFPLDPTNTFDQFLPQNYEWPEDEKEMLYQLKRRYTRLGSTVNAREIANYLAYTPDDAGNTTTIETLTGQQWFVLPSTPPTEFQQTENRTTFRKVVRFPTALVAGLNTQLHGITVGSPTTFIFTKIYGTVFRQAAPPLFVAAPNDNIHLEVTDTLVNLTVPALYAGFFGLTVLEYLKF